MRNTQVEADSAHTRKNEDTNFRVGTESAHDFGALLKRNFAVDINIFDTIKVEDLIKYEFVYQ